jgi:hypothetical protein
MTLTARANPQLWVFVVLTPALGGLVWAGVHAWTSGVADTRYSGYGSRILNALPPQALAVLFFAGAAACTFALAIAIRARTSDRPMLEISQAGITSRVLGGRGKLAWPVVTHLTRNDMWLYVHGKEPSGRSRKLAVSLLHLDKSAGEILTAIREHRPDLVEQQISIRRVSEVEA